MTDIRRLDPITDEALYHIAFGWLEDAPNWRQETEAVFGTMDREQYLANTLDTHRVDIGVFDGPEFVAVIVLVLRAKNVYEGHFESKPDIDRITVVHAAQMVAHQMFANYGAQAIYCWTPTFNRPVIAINKAIGFHADRVNMLRGTVRGRLVDWQRWSMRNSYGRTQDQTNPNQ